jgi:hypothetical protein
MKRTVFAALLAVLTAATAYAIDPGQTELEVNGWFRYTNQSTEFKVTSPSVSRFSVDRGYVRLSQQWTPQLFSKVSIDFLSSASYADGTSVRLKEAYLDLALPLKDFTFTAGLQKHYFGLIYSWDYTHPEKELADDRGVCASADYGVTVNGFLPSGLGEVQLGVYNGEGYKMTGKFLETSPELLANLRLTPFGGVQIGASAFTSKKDISLYTNSTAGGKLSPDRKKWLLPDTANTNRLGIAPMLKVSFGPVAVTGEYIIYNYARTYGYYSADSASGAISDSTYKSGEKKYAQFGFDVVPVVTLIGRKLEVFGRFALWDRKEDDVRADDKSFTRYGAGANWHFHRRASGKPGAEFQLAWTRDLTKKEGAKPTDTFSAQFRFEFSHVISGAN